MDTLIVDTAQYLPYVVVLVGVVVWLVLPLLDKVALAVQGIVTLIIVLILIVVAGHVHNDPRPFVVDPSVHPLFHHAPDNGFPSDHEALAMAVALLITLYRRIIGVVLIALAILIGVARVAAHVHHVQDIVGGAGIAVVAVAVSMVVWWLLRPVVAPRVTTARSKWSERRSSTV